MTELLTASTPEQMYARALVRLDTGADPQQLIDTAAQWVRHLHSVLAERQAAGEFLDGRASIYTGETYAEARDRWATYRGLLLDHLRGPDGGGC